MFKRSVKSFMFEIMFYSCLCRFSQEENVSSISNVKNSVQRTIQSQILTQYPALTPVIEQLLPKKSIQLAKWYVVLRIANGSFAQFSYTLFFFLRDSVDHLQLVLINNQVIFFNQRDGPFYPTLQTLHKCNFKILFVPNFNR